LSCVGTLWIVSLAPIEIWDKASSRGTISLVPKNSILLVLKEITSLRQDEKVLSVSRGWRHVTNCDGIQGWIVSDYFLTSYLQRLA